MPEVPSYNVWEGVVVSLTTALVTLAGVVGIQKKTGAQTTRSHDSSRTDIRLLQDRCKDLENDVEHLKEKIADQAKLLKEAERRVDEFSRVVFTKLEAMSEVLIEIRVALGIGEARKHE